MKIVITADTGAYELKKYVAAHLTDAGYTVLDADGYANIPFYEAAAAGAKMIQQGQADCGIFICGTGAGMNITANKFQGITAVCAESVFTAEKAKIINNANVLAMGAFVVDPEKACAMADAWLNADFTQGLDEKTAEFLRKAEKDIFRIQRSQNS